MQSALERTYLRARRLATEYKRAEAERLMRDVLAGLDRGADAGELTRGRVLISLADLRAELGNIAEGLAILQDLESTLSSADPLFGMVSSQRAHILQRSGRHVEAGRAFDEAARRMQEDPRELFVLLLNRGSFHLAMGHLQAARADYAQCVLLADAAGDALRRLKARNNLAYVDYVAADIPRALSGFAQVQSDPELAAPGLVAEVRLMRADALLAAGLFAEADSELSQAVTGFAQLRMYQDRAEAEAVRAQIALVEERFADAARLAGRARRGFARRGSTGWALVAELIGLQARLAADRRPLELAQRCAEVREVLHTAGLVDDAAVAALTAARAFLRAGALEEATAWSVRGSARRSGHRITTRLQASGVRADIAAATGRPRRADAERRAGLRDLHRYQASFGSLDVQTAVVRHGWALVRAGLAEALASGRPSAVYSWAEQGRALASRLPPVRPPDDPEAAQLLQELRLVRIRLREAELAGDDDPGLRARRADLERRVRQRSWYAPGPGEVERPASLGAVRETLRARGPNGVLVAHILLDGVVHALVIGPRGTTVLRLGAAADVLEAMRRVSADLDALAVRGYPPGLRQAVTRSLARGMTALDDLLWRPLATSTGDGPVVLVPAGALVAVPWTTLPGLSGRPVAVARSATAWCHSPAPGEFTGRAVVAAGPDLARADDEIRDVGGLWRGTQVLSGPAATGDALVRAAAGASLVHVAAHGHHESANPLFSSLRLADGPLFGYDMVRLVPAPRHVVLSACDLGMVVSRPGDEVLGMTAALLHAGVDSVLASVARVNDDVACDVVVDYHRCLRAGDAPSVALTRALDGRPDAPFICLGGGW